MFFKCRNCGAPLIDKDIVGQWVCCPHCNSRFLVDYAEESGSGRKRENFHFPFDCDMKAFQTYCFDLLMQQSPADVISQMRLLEEKECFLPTITTIGRSAGERYSVNYIGKEPLDEAILTFLQKGFDNADVRFGHERRLRVRELPKSAIAVAERFEAEGAAVTNEVHYFPLFYLKYEYKGRTFCFISLGDVKRVFNSQLPREELLSERPRYTLSDTALNVAAAISVILMAVAIAIPLCTYGRELYLEQELYRASTWFWVIAVVLLISVYVILKRLIQFVLKLFFLPLTFCIGMLVQMFTHFVVNKMKLRSYLNIVEPIQQRKQRDAMSLYQVNLNDLHIDTKIPSIEMFDISDIWHKFRK